MLLKAKIFCILSFISIKFCSEKTIDVPEDAPACGTIYNLSDIYFTEEDTLFFRIKFHFILPDSATKADTHDLKEFFRINNTFFKHARIQFINYGYCETVDLEESHNMPNFKKYSIRHSDEGFLNVFIYDNKQPFYTGDKENVVGVAGGIGSTFFAVRENFLATLTSTHELFHCFGLKHIDEPDDTNGYNDFTGDLVCDTPTASNLGSKINYLCQYVGKEELSVQEKELLSKNVMSWVYLHCREAVTPNQIARLKWIIQNSKDLRDCIEKPVL